MKKYPLYLRLANLVLFLLFSCAQLPDAPEKLQIGNIVGKVTDSNTNVGLLGVSISTTPATKTVVTDSSGDYSIMNIDAETYTVKASMNGYEDKNISVTVSVGVTATANIRLSQEKGSISGKVTDAATGSGIGGVTITTSPSTQTVTTNTSGEYTITNITPGSYTVKANKSGYGEGTASVSVTAGGTATANIELSKIQNTLTIEKGGNGSGSVRVNGNLEELPYNGSFNNGTNVTLEAVAEDGSVFSGWSGDLGGTNPSTSITIDGNKTVTATFTLEQYTISTSSNPSEGGTTTGGGTYSYGEQVTVTASPSTGYNFVNWTEEGVEVPTNASYSFTATNNRTLVANFTLYPNKGEPCPGLPKVYYEGGPNNDSGGDFYYTVQIGEQCWLRENLNIGIMINRGQYQQSDNGIEKYCYNDSASYCNKYGGLYQWDEAMQYSTAEGAQGICPDGWHIPTKLEYQLLVPFGASKLVDESEITTSYTATNETGFSALFGGSNHPGSSASYGLGEYGNFWSSLGRIDGEDNASMFILHNFNNSWIAQHYNGSMIGVSIRCLKD